MKIICCILGMAALKEHQSCDYPKVLKQQQLKRLPETVFYFNNLKWTVIFNLRNCSKTLGRVK